MIEDAVPNSEPVWDPEIELLAQTLPSHLYQALHERIDPSELLEIVLDLGREPEARVPGREVLLGDRAVTAADLDYVANRVGQFGDDNRAGIERTLHRVSAIRNRGGRIVGLTCRVGRAVGGTAEIIRDIALTGQSILLLGRPGIGKTTILRECARLLADEQRKRVVIVDTSNEIGGDGDIPHPGIGRARRMQVRTPLLQHNVMIEAVENHMPEVIVIDEIGTELEALAARTIAERGVQLIGTAHGNTLDNLMQNPTLSDLIGGIQTVTLSDEEARRRGTQKSVLERKAPPTFDVVVEIQDWHHVIVHPDVARTVDNLLLGRKVEVQVRQRDERSQVTVTLQELAEEEALDEMGDHGLPDPAEGKADHGDAELHTVYDFVQVAVQSLQNASADATRSDELLDAGLTDADQRKFGSGKESVGRYQGYNQQNPEQHKCDHLRANFNISKLFSHFSSVTGSYNRVQLWSHVSAPIFS